VEWTTNVVERLSAAGYEVHVVLIDVSTATAVHRVKQRALGLGGRYVPVTYVESISDRPRDALDALVSNARITSAVALSCEGGPTQPPSVITARGGWGDAVTTSRMFADRLGEDGADRRGEAVCGAR
jgi:NAD(P)-dependent dehydrogenase (short-subunit alcohol dehydrogenase family)